jgi:hypothetical protein
MPLEIIAYRSNQIGLRKESANARFRKTANYTPMKSYFSPQGMEHTLGDELELPR